MCCSPERWSTPEGNGGLCARRSTQKPPRSDCHPKPSPLKNSKVTATSKGGMSRGRGRAAGVRVPGHVQPSTHSSLQTSWMLRLWQVVEQDLVHSLYFIPIGHLGTGKHREKRKTWRVPITAWTHVCSRLRLILQHWLSSSHPCRSIPCAWQVRAYSSRMGQ